MTAENMTPIMRDILSAAEGSSDLWLSAHGASRSTVNVMKQIKRRIERVLLDTSLRIVVVALILLRSTRTAAGESECAERKNPPECRPQVG
jgi:hypothetical protein